MAVRFARMPRTAAGLSQVTPGSKVPPGVIWWALKSPHGWTGRRLRHSGTGQEVFPWDACRNRMAADMSASMRLALYPMRENWQPTLDAGSTESHAPLLGWNRWRAEGVALQPVCRRPGAAGFMSGWRRPGTKGASERQAAFLDPAIDPRRGAWYSAVRFSSASPCRSSPPSRRPRGSSTSASTPTPCPEPRARTRDPACSSTKVSARSP